MARTLQAAALPRIETRQLPAGAALAALGIVYGDIGTSALYGFKQAADAGGTPSPETIMGIVSTTAARAVSSRCWRSSMSGMRRPGAGAPPC
jgi:hypothetical protein